MEGWHSDQPVTLRTKTIFTQRLCTIVVAKPALFLNSHQGVVSLPHSAICAIWHCTASFYMSPVALCSETTWKRVIYFSRHVLDELNHCSYANAWAPLCLWFLNVSSFSWILAAVSFFKSHSCVLRSTKRQSRRIVLQSTIIHANKW